MVLIHLKREKNFRTVKQFLEFSKSRGLDYQSLNTQYIVWAFLIDRSLQLTPPKHIVPKIP